MTMQQQPKKTKQIVKEQKPIAEPKKASMQQLPLIMDLMAIPKEDREARSTQYFQKIQPFFHSYAQKKMGSRVLQLIFKWGDVKVKEEMHRIIKKYWKQLIKSKYALYLIEHVAKEFPIPEIVDDVVLLQGTWEGAKIIQAELENTGEEGAKLIKKKFIELWEQNKSNDLKAQETLHNLSLQVIEKHYDNLTISKLILRLALGSMFAEEKQKVLEYLSEKVAEWVGDEQGVRLFFQLVNHSDPKQKKQIVRSFKGHVTEIVALNNPTYVALCKALTEVDDTVFVHKTLQSEVEQLFPLMSSNKHAFSVIFSIFSPRNHNFNILGKYQHAVTYTECKKSEETRKRDLRTPLYESLLAFLSGQELENILRHHINNKLIIAIYKSLEQDHLKEQYTAFISKIATLFLEDAKTAIQAKKFSESLVADPNANKILKQILLLSDEAVDFFCDQFGKLATRNLKDFLDTKASFVLLGLIEKGGRDYLLQQVKRNRKLLEKAVAGQHYQNLLKKK